MNKAKHTPTELPALFPIPDAVLQHTTELYSEFSPEELEALRLGNLEAIQPGDPVRYLLEGKARPTLLDGQKPKYHDTAWRAYGVGVCVGAAIMRRHIRLLRQNGDEIPDIALDPEADTAPVFERDWTFMFQSERWRRLGPALMPEMFRRKVDQTLALARPAQYMSDANSNMLLGFMKRSMQEHGIPFVEDGRRKLGTSACISFGVGDAFELYEHLYAEATAPFDRTVVERTLETRRPGVDEMSLVPATMEDYAVIGKVQTKTGYRQCSYLTGEYRVRQGTAVPQGTVLTDLYRQRASTRLFNYGQTGELEQVEYGRKHFLLGKDDRVVVRGKDDQLFALAYPFKVPPEISHDGVVELQGHYSPRRDYNDLRDEPAKAAQEDKHQADLRAFLEQLAPSEHRSRIGALLADKVLPLTIGYKPRDVALLGFAQFSAPIVLPQPGGIAFMAATMPLLALGPLRKRKAARYTTVPQDPPFAEEQ